jgi:NAD(P)-dependent dehydrogenase (short-subunit alcohol dehydrogenase family)
MRIQSGSADYLAGLFRLEGLVAVVTGGGGQIGSGLCAGLARAGAEVVVLGRSAANCQPVADGIVAEGGRATAVIADVFDPEQLDAARARIATEFGRLDVLVNTIGSALVPKSRVTPDVDLFGAELLEGTRAVIELNLIGPLLATFAFGPLLAEAGGGSIVNVSSGSARHVSSGVMGYSAGKAGLEQLTRWMSVEAARRYGGRVRINAISPGYTVGAKSYASYFDGDGSLKERARQIVSKIPAGRLGVPEDLVTAVLFLCSPASSYVIGQVIAVDGGMGLEIGT